MRRAIALALVGQLVAMPALAAELTVAAAPSAREALEAVATAFKHDTGHDVRFVFASSGKLYAQLKTGLPCALFFSADDVYPARLHTEGRAEAPHRYAEGRLVVWVRRGAGLDPARGLALVSDARVRRVAIANPELAPYGRAAAQALEAAGLAAAAAPKLVLGENVAQAAQFVSSGAADVGLVPLSLARSPELMRVGRYALVPASLHAPLHADAAVMSAAPDRALARQFLAFATSGHALPIWRRYGLAARP